MSSNGCCAIKPEFVVKDHTPKLSKDDIKDEAFTGISESDLNGSEYEPASKIMRLSKSEKKSKRGQNKARPPPYRVADNDRLCRILTNVLETETKTCEFPNCKYQHDLVEYLKNKPKDIGETCYVYNVKGRCPMGVSCRFGSVHITPEGCNKVLPDYILNKPTTLNQLEWNVQLQLRKKKYDFSKAKEAVTDAEKLRIKKNDEIGVKMNSINESELGTGNEVKEAVMMLKDLDKSVEVVDNNRHTSSGCVTDEDVIQIRKSEKKFIDWRDKLFLSPLTTVGNLPFRRICKEFGADVTCGEMAVSVPIINGAPQEWALVKRHETEDLFGVQLCGNKPLLVAYAAQVLQDTCSIDFVDINLGCPIELIYRQGGGSALLQRQGILEVLVRSCSSLLDIPLTVKTRTGVYANKSVAHKLITKFKEWGASLVTVHGRSREQRYTRKADWEYIEECAKIGAEIEGNNGIPVIGNGDIMSYEDFIEAKNVAPHITGVMLGRGALVKPWLFSEIKEQKARDISSHERFEIIKRYVNYGLEHWGSDTKGVENTRRFFLEWQSFLYRYVPLGLLERPPQRINERPPAYHGRDELETLMASGKCTDWIKLSEMLLGPVPEGFSFLPKHKANSYE